MGMTEKPISISLFYRKKTFIIPKTKKFGGHG